MYYIIHTFHEEEFFLMEKFKNYVFEKSKLAYILKRVFLNEKASEMKPNENTP